MVRARIRQPRFLDLPSVLIAGSWVGLWLLWPGGGQQAAGEWRAFEPRVVYTGASRRTASLVIQPDLVMRHRLDPMAAEDAPGAGVPVSLLTRPGRGSLFLEESESGGRLAPGIKLPAGSMVPQADEFRTPWRDEDVFSGLNGQGMRMVVRAEGELKEYGFEAPVLTAGTEGVEGAWMLTAWVSVDEHGLVKHVLLESGEGNPVVRKSVLLGLKRGRLSRTGTPCSGRVVVSYGAP